MATATVNDVPNPWVHLSASPGVRISTDDALSYIQTYLEDAKPNIYLHPDAHFTESGLTSAGRSSGGGVILQQLRRVEQGLQGVWLGIDPEADNDTYMFPHVKSELDGVLDDEPIGDYQQQLREQGFGDVSGEVDKRNNAVGNVDHIEPVVATHARKRPHEEVNGVDAVAETPVKDKEARKKAKKDRKQIDKKGRKEAREKQNNQEDGPSQPNGSSQAYVASNLGGDSEPHVQVESSQTVHDSQNSEQDQSSQEVRLNPRAKLSASPNQYSFGQHEELAGEASSPTPTPAPPTNGHVSTVFDTNGTAAVDG